MDNCQYFCFLLCSIVGVHALLRKLQFLFELPARLNKCLELQAYAQAVTSYRQARCVLQQYSHLPSFRGIQDDCHAIINKLAQELRQKFRSVSVPMREASLMDHDGKTVALKNPFHSIEHDTLELN